MAEIPGSGADRYTVFVNNLVLMCSIGVRRAERDRQPLAIEHRIDGERSVTEVTIYTLDTHGLFARLAGAKLVVIPQSPGAVPGTGDYIAHMDHVVTALAKALADP